MTNLEMSKLIFDQLRRIQDALTMIGMILVDSDPDRQNSIQEKEKQKDEEEKKESTKERKEEEERIREKEPSMLREGVLGETKLESSPSLAGAPALKTGKRKRSCKPLTSIAPDEGLSEKGEAYARSVGMTEEQVWDEFENFKDYHLRKGNLWADWSAAWRTWCRNWKKFRANRGNDKYLKEIKS